MDYKKSMTLYQLKIFQTIARCRNFTQAAAELHVSQPSISVQIRQLEEELEVPLFDRLGKRVALTEAGRLLERYVQRIFAVTDEARKAIDELKGLERGRLLIGASTTPGIYLLPRVLSCFQRRFPRIETLLTLANTRLIEEKILHNELDIGIVGGHLVEDGITLEPYVTDEIVLAVGQNHPFYQRKQITLEELRKEKLIVREKGSATREVAERRLKEAGIILKPSLELGNPEAVKQAVAEGLGVAFLSKFSIQLEVQIGRLKSIDIQDFSLTRPLSIVYHKDKSLLNTVSAFLRVAHEVAESFSGP